MGKPVSDFVARLLDVTFYDPPFLCEDCGKPTDLGSKCRACYAQFQALLSQEHPRHLRELHATCKALRAHPLRKNIAVTAEGGGSAGVLSRDAAELCSQVRRVLAGPFGQSMHGLVKAIASGKDAPAPGDEKPAYAPRRLNGRLD